MGVVIWIIIGLIAGWLATAIIGGRAGGLLRNLAIGLIGAIIGGLIFSSLAIVPTGFLGALVSATVGAIIFLVVWRAIKWR
ncbi:MAG: GlsB/YeaQ/YmgE family stress response membrane protein [Pseudolabrys sp.]|jgi:uncharacterized membrane protein YeaQ/YmgE (transglycosylase-associated protein family)